MAAWCGIQVRLLIRCAPSEVHRGRPRLDPIQAADGAMGDPWLAPTLPWCWKNLRCIDEQRDRPVPPHLEALASVQADDGSLRVVLAAVAEVMVDLSPKKLAYVCTKGVSELMSIMALCAVWSGWLCLSRCLAPLPGRGPSCACSGSSERRCGQHLGHALGEIADADHPAEQQTRGSERGRGPCCSLDVAMAPSSSHLDAARAGL